MKPISRFFLVTALVAASMDPAGAAPPPTVDSVLAKHVEATGGKAALEKLSSRIIRGRVENEMLPGAIEWTFYAKAPSKQLVVVEIPGLGTTEDGFDGVTAWSKNVAGVRVKSGEELEKVKRDSSFRRELNFKKLFPNLTYKGTQTVANEEANVLESAPTPASRERFFFSRKTGLLLRQESEYKNEQGLVESNAELSDYRGIDGVKVPFLIKGSLKASGQTMDFTLRVSEVKHNVSIEDSKFAKPAS